MRRPLEYVSPLQVAASLAMHAVGLVTMWAVAKSGAELLTGKGLTLALLLSPWMILSVVAGTYSWERSPFARIHVLTTVAVVLGVLAWRMS